MDLGRRGAKNCVGRSKSRWSVARRAESATLDEDTAPKNVMSGEVAAAERWRVALAEN